MSTRVLIADDQRLVRAGLRVLLEQHDDLEVAGEAADGAEAIALAQRRAVDVVLMDIRMPNVDGLEATRQLLGRHGDALRVLVLTTFDADAYVFEALRSGASGYLLKDAPEEELVAAIRVVARGDAIVAPAVTRRLVERFAALPERGATPRASLPDELTAREREVLAEVARGRSNAEIAEALVVTRHTVKTHVARLLMKLGLRDRVQLVVFAYESGFVAPGEDQAAGEIAPESDGAGAGRP
ncbi:response regulator [Baekduia sp. Peel2402]|uniref:response regulator n=1 Tax=Baekduia sp. Peel2402 TaxID=3458296 RepID=UPI00403E9575